MRPAQTFPAGDIIREEMEERGWTEEELSRRTVIPLDELRAILAGGRVGVRESVGLGRAFGVDDGLFARIDIAHRRRPDR